MSEQPIQTSDQENRQLGPVLPKPIPFAMALTTAALILTAIVWPQTYLPQARHNTSGNTASVSSIFEAPTLTARAAIVYDVHTQEILFEKNADAQLPLASITKLMPALVATESLPHDAMVTITPSALKSEGDSGFIVGEAWNLMDLIDATLVTSSNDGATALAGAVGDGSIHDAVSMMNKRARELGLHHTYFLNPTGLDESDTMAGAYGSAHDIAILLAHLITQYPEALNRTAFNSLLLASQDGEPIDVNNTNEAIGDIPGLIAGKTGYTNLAGGNFAIAFDIEVGHPVVVVVLGSTQEGRFEDVRLLVRATRDAFQ